MPILEFASRFFSRVDNTDIFDSLDRQKTDLLSVEFDHMAPFSANNTRRSTFPQTNVSKSNRICHEMYLPAFCILLKVKQKHRWPNLELFLGFPLDLIPQFGIDHRRNVRHWFFIVHRYPHLYFVLLILTMARAKISCNFSSSSIRSWP